MSSAQRLRELIDADETLLAPGTFDALTASIVESLGFDAVYLGGYATGASTGHTEPAITMSEMCDRAREITEHVSIPLVADGNAGFGDAAHTYRAVNAYAKAGIAGMHIEDQVYPKRLHYHAGIKRTVGVDEMIHKIEAACDARDDHGEDIVLVARSDAARGQRRDHETIEDAVGRVNAYLDAGADAGMLFPASGAELRYAADNVDGPLAFVMVEGREPRPTADELTELGVAVSLYALSATIAAAQRIHDLYATLAETGDTGLDAGGFTEYMDFVEERIDLPTYYEIEERSGKK